MTDHYERLLAEHYTWMLGGDIEAVALAQEELFRQLGVGAGPDEDASAVDLGCGPGPQTLALVRLGFGSVTAVDTSAVLLRELEAYAARSGVAPAVRTHHADIRGALPQVAELGSVSAVVCMGDTLPHLPGRDDVSNLLEDVARALRPGGSFVATYRDLTHELRGTDRFILVRGSEDRILTCFLEYRDEGTVLVHDLLHTQSDGEWQLRGSSYPKLRMAPSWLSDQCRAAGLDVLHHEAGHRGLLTLHATRRQS